MRTDRSFKVRAAAAQKIGHLKNLPKEARVQMLQALQACLLDDHHLVRGVCAQALGLQNAWGARKQLQALEQRERDPYALKMTKEALAALKPPWRPGAPRLELGKVRFMAGGGLSQELTRSLERAAANAVEDKIEPHRPALFPREQPDLRIDVSIHRSAKTALKGQDVHFVVRVLLLQLPGAQLRHASEAMASARGTRRQGQVAESKLMLRAVDRAVQEALSMVYPE